VAPPHTRLLSPQTEAPTQQVCHLTPNHASNTNHKADNPLSISNINPNGFSAFQLCTFYGSNGAAIPGVSRAGTDVAVGPPQPVSAVACAATGENNTCLPVYGKYMIIFYFNWE
jgi:hypothetical protein